jgi:hypothetical protein
MKKTKIKKTGSYKGKSNKLGHGGRAAQMKAQGVPQGVIGMMARKAQAAPGQKNYHGKKATSAATRYENGKMSYDEIKKNLKK